jgi:hypothetical protein
VFIGILDEINKIYYVNVKLLRLTLEPVWAGCSVLDVCFLNLCKNNINNDIIINYGHLSIIGVSSIFHLLRSFYWWKV